MDIGHGAADLRVDVYVCKTQIYERNTPNGLAFNIIRPDGTLARWAKDSKLLYFIKDEGISADAIPDIREAMAVAASNWAATGLTVSFHETLCQKDATFLVVYNACLNRNIFAQAFFPGDARRRIDLGLRFFDDAKHMSNILTHELGHVLGLRHEYWDACGYSEDNNVYQYPTEDRDEFSIMNQKHARNLSLLVLSKQDCKFIFEFYSLPAGRHGGFSIEECCPEPYLAS